MTVARSAPGAEFAPEGPEPEDSEPEDSNHKGSSAAAHREDPDYATSSDDSDSLVV